MFAGDPLAPLGRQRGPAERYGVVLGADRDPRSHEANLFDLDAKYADVVRLSEAVEQLRARR